MEDRVTPGLYLELGDASPEEYAAERVPVVLARAGVERATWWARAHDGRHPRSRLPEADVLGVYELDGSAFTPPPAPDGFTGLHLRHYPRPGQGTLTGRPTLGLLVVLISPDPPEAAQHLRDWGDFVHLRHIAAAAVPGFTMITPYENVGTDGPRFLHCYEMDTDDPQAAYDRMLPLVMARLGGAETPEFADWAGHPALCIDYVNTFRRVGNAGKLRF